MINHSVIRTRSATLSESDVRDLRIAKLVEIAVWLAFVGTLGRGVFHNNDLLRRITFRPMIDVAGGVLILGGIKTFLERRRAFHVQGIHQLTCAVLAIAVFAMVHGLASNPSIVLWFQMGLMGFGTGFAVFLAARPFVFDRVFNALRRQILFADVFGVYFLLSSPSEDRFNWFWTEQGNEGLGAIANRCFFALPFLIGSYRRLTLWEVLLVSIGFVEYLFLNLRGENRSAVIIALLVIPVLLMAIMWRQRQFTQQIWKAMLCAGIVLLILFHGGSWNDGFDRVMQRFGVADASHAEHSEIISGMDLTISENFTGNGSRAEELRELVSDTSFAQFIFGRGFGVSWYCPLWASFSPEWYMVHFGPGYMVLVGGVPLAICVTALLGLAIWKAWINVTLHQGAAGALLFLSAAAVNYVQHGVFLDEPEFYFLWLCVGFSVSGPMGTISRSPVRGTGLRRRVATYA